jgi:hypothetical protein
LAELLTSLEEEKRCCCEEDEKNTKLCAVIYIARSHAAAFSINDKVPVLLEKLFEF